MAVQSLKITGFLKLNLSEAKGVDDFKKRWDSDPDFPQQIQTYVPEFLGLCFGEVENNMIEITVDFKIDPSLSELFLAVPLPPNSNTPYQYHRAAHAAVGTLMERVFWLPQKAPPRIIGAWGFANYGIRTYGVDGEVYQAKVPGGAGPGGGGSKGGEK